MTVRISEAKSLCCSLLRFQPDIIRKSARAATAYATLLGPQIGGREERYQDGDLEVNCEEPWRRVTWYLTSLATSLVRL